MLFKYKSVYVPQVDEMDCGVACLAMILKQYHSRISLAHLRHEARTNLEGTTVYIFTILLDLSLPMSY